MKLILRSALLLVAIALGVVLWVRRDGASGAAVPAVKSSDSAAMKIAHQPAAVEAPAPQAREEVAVAQPAPAESIPNTALVRVSVTNELGEALASVKLGIREAVGQGSEELPGAKRLLPPMVEQTCDVTGRAEFVVEPGIAYEVECIDDRFAPRSLRVDALAANETREVGLALDTRDDLVLRGRVVDDADGTPLINAHIKLGRVGAFQTLGGDALPSDVDLKKDAVAVDADGRFELHGQSALLGFAFAFADGYARAVFGLEKGHETPEHAIELRLARVASVDALVRDALGGVQGAKVDLSTQSYGLQQGSKSKFYNAADPHWTAQTDEDGLAHVPDLPPNLPLTVLVRTPDGSSRQQSVAITLTPGEQRTLEIVMGVNASVSGRIEDRDGHVIAKWPVWCMRAETKGPRWFASYEKPAMRTQSDDNGRFSFSDVPIGSWSIGPAPSREQSRSQAAPDFTGLAQTVEIRDGGERREIVLVVDRNLHLRGTVVDPSGAAVANCSVFAYLPRGRASANGSSDSAGHFDLGPLPAAQWSLRADQHRGRHAPSEDLAVDAGTDDIVLQLRAGGAIRGHVIDGQTHSVAACEISLATRDSSFGGTRTDSSDGSFAFEGVLPGSYVVSARTSDGRQARMRAEVQAGTAADELELALAPGAKLVLSYTGNEPFCSFTLSVDGDKIDFDNVEPGKPNTRIVPPGTIEVHWRLHILDFQQFDSLTLGPGEQRVLIWTGRP